MTNNLRELAEKATPGPWRFGISDWNQDTNVVVEVKPFDYTSGRHSDNPGIFGVNNLMVVGCDEYDVFRSTADKAYLTAASPDVVLALLEEIDRLRSVIQLTYDNSMSLALHPDDDHFRFGPISSELRKWAADDAPTMTTDIELAARSIVMNNLPDSMAPVDIETRRMFLLILSESLASEGL
jgi:hypothetical protein